MIKKIILPALLVAAFGLTACGSKDSAFTGTTKGEVKDEKGTTIADVTFEEGTVKAIEIEFINPDGTSKTEASKSGAYVMKEGGTPWHEQIDLLEAFLVENNGDTSKVTLTNDAGNTDAVTGVSIKVGEYLGAVDAAIEKSKEAK